MIHSSTTARYKPRGIRGAKTREEKRLRPSGTSTRRDAPASFLTSRHIYKYNYTEPNIKRKLLLFEEQDAQTLITLTHSLTLTLTLNHKPPPPTPPQCPPNTAHRNSRPARVPHRVVPCRRCRSSPIDSHHHQQSTQRRGHQRINEATATKRRFFKLIILDSPVTT